MIKKELKELLVIAKRFFANSEKATAKIIIQTDGNKIKVQCSSKQLISYYELTKVDTEEFSIEVNPFELEKIIKGKGVHFEAGLFGDKLVELETQSKIACLPFEDKVKFEFEAVRAFENPETFMKLLKETEDLFEETPYEGTQYLQIKPNAAIAVSPKRIHSYHYEEHFCPNIIYLHGDAISILTKSLKGEIAHSIHEECFVIQNKNAYYIAIPKKRVAYPDLRKLVYGKESIFSFRVDAYLVSEAIKSYKKLKLIEIKFEGDNIVIDPRSEEFQEVQIPIDSFKGTPIKVVFDFETIKQFFTSYDNYVTIEHKSFKNIVGEDGFTWWSHEPQKLVMVAGVTEPDYQSEWEKEKSIG